MKSIYSLVFFLFLVIGNSIAQNLIAVQNGGAPRFYSILQDAFTNAQNKDTIYIPGGAYSLTSSQILINKELHLIGTGHHPDSTSVTGITQLNANIYLLTGASNSTFEGLKFSAFSTGYQSANFDVDNVTVSRCYSSQISLSGLSTNWLISENVISMGISGGASTTVLSSGAQTNIISNNIINGSINYFGPNNLVKNNVIMADNYATFSYIDGCVFQNNILFYSANGGGVTSCIFENNISFVNSFPATIIRNNISSQTASNTFVNQTGTTFQYTHDYHLKSDSQGKNAGKDGTDIGIYGGIYPWKAGSVPSNPHFQTINIAPKTDNNGNLNVKIKVAAQDH